ncbi:CaiB/BaiF CoA-transferase family protein [Novosphingobium sp. AAP93]|uniref:CaiB/BaiF CoA transferase family protein n=1 Tax=Novosphingobium sp. AAP93 TaxID=1523427 RepID=UPI0006B8868E|nr:CoA transferase [Novosphingobium sp. AAP93]KPF80632.1 carnitine dehydratase [Novosphingobium sp. AAP93]
MPPASLPQGAFEGLKVLDLATFIAGPYCATYLAEFGADVVKVELAGSGDPVRKFGTPTEAGDTLVWLSEGRNKRSLELDLRTPEGAETLLRLAAKADVLVENFQPGTLERWGIGPDVLQALNPRLIIARVTAYGQTGPYRDRPGFGRIANAFSGISFLCGEPDAPPASPGTATLSDYLTGVYAALGVLTALHVRERTGRGQIIDLGLYEGTFRLLDELAPAYARHGYVRQRMGAGTVNAVPHSHYPTKDGKWVAIACTNDKIFGRLAEVMDRMDVTGDGIYGTIRKREARRAEVDAFVSHWTSGMTRDEVLAACEAGQVPCGPVYGIDEIFEDPQYAARGNLVCIEDERAGELTLPAVCPRLSATPGAIRWAGRALGADSAAVLADWLG